MCFNADVSFLMCILSSPFALCPVAPKVFRLLNFLDAVYDFHHSKHREEPIYFVFYTESNGACQNVCCEETNYVIRTKRLL